MVVDSNLLRSIRYLLPAEEADVAAEARAWQHADVYSTASGFRFESAAAKKYQEDFAALPSELRSRAVNLLRTHHAALPNSVRYAELALCAELAPDSVESREVALLEEWQSAIAKTCFEHPDMDSLKSWLARHVGRQSSFSNPAAKALWALSQRDKIDLDQPIELPPGVRPEDVGFLLQQQDSQSLQGVLRQRGEALFFEVEDFQATGSPLAELTVASGRIFVMESGKAGAALGTGGRYVQVRQPSQMLLPLKFTTAAAVFTTAQERITLAQMAKPDWALAIGRNQTGLYADVYCNARHRLSWHAPQVGETTGYWKSEQPLGVDDYGLYADLTVETGITQRFRWIASGTFMMGSPKTEAGRSDDEVQHEVTLSLGYWLADTACTQALWQAVMGENPSLFSNDPHNPIDQVSWDDAQQFIAKLNQRFPDLNACLPNEAQWEYACRAGTTTPFSFGENITPEQVNYNGDISVRVSKQGLNPPTHGAGSVAAAQPMGPIRDAWQCVGMV